MTASRQDCERWFVRRGVPHFIEGYSATEDVFTRALPVLIFFFLLGAANGIELDWSWWVTLLALLGGLALIMAAWVALNLVRRRRAWARPQRVGWPEIGVFLFVPALPALLISNNWIVAASTVAIQAILLGLVFVITSYGLVAIAKWAIGRLFRTLGQTFSVFTRSLPLLLLGFLFLFINAEAWQSAGQLETGLLIVIVALLAVLATLFVLSQVPRELKQAADFNSWDQVHDAADDGPELPVPSPASQPSPPPLRLRERWNLTLVVLVTQGFRLLLVSVVIAAFFVVLGLLLIQADTAQLWLRSDPEVLWAVTVGGVELEITRPLVQVSVFLGAFAAVYFSVYAAIDSTWRTDFFDDTIQEMRQNLAVRALYRAGNNKAPSLP